MINSREDFQGRPEQVLPAFLVFLESGARLPCCYWHTFYDSTGQRTFIQPKRFPPIYVVPSSAEGGACQEYGA